MRRLKKASTNGTVVCATSKVVAPIFYSHFDVNLVNERVYQTRAQSNE